MDSAQAALLLLAVALALVPIFVFIRTRPTSSSPRAREAFTPAEVARSLDPTLAVLGFSRNNHTFERERPEFFDRITIEILNDEDEDEDESPGADSAVAGRISPRIAVVLGVQARWSAETAAPPDAETCEIRHVVHADGAPDGWWNCGAHDGPGVDELVRAVSSDVVGFFGYFSSIDASFGAIDIFEIDQHQLPRWFETSSRARTTLYAARAHRRAGRSEQALTFAQHGLREAGPAVALKAEFREIIEGAERAIKAAWASAPSPARQDLAATLRLKPGERYLPLPIPSPRDEELIRLLTRSSAPLLEDEVRPEHAQVLLAFAERAATLAVRRRDTSVLTAGLKALTLAADLDARDATILLPLYFDAAMRLDSDPAVLFATAVVSAPKDGVAASLRSFANRSPEDRSLEAMGYVASADSDGFRYQRTW